MDPCSPARFAAACGAVGPLPLLVERADGAVVAQGDLDQPFALVGRDPDCDLSLQDPAVGLRHALLLALGGRVFVADLGSKGGTHWADGRRPGGWLDPGSPVRVGPFRVHLTAAVSPIPRGDGDPLAAGSAAHLPRVAVEFRTGKASRPAWAVNRAVTLVGRAAECRLRLAADDISPVHCALALTPDGLWVIDLLGRGGVQVNGEPVRFRRLGNGDELRVGRFALGISVRDAAVRLAKPAAVAVLRPGAAVVPALPAAAAGFEQFQQSLAMVLQTFGQMHREQMATVQQELARVAELTAELTRLRAGVGSAAPPPPAVPALPPANPLPLPETLPKASAETAELHGHVWERMAALESERQSVWKRLFRAA